MVLDCRCAGGAARSHVFVAPPSLWKPSLAPDAAPPREVLQKHSFGRASPGAAEREVSSQGFKLPKSAFGKPKDLLPKSPLNPPRNDYCQIRYKLCTICFADYDRQTNDCSILHVPSSDDGRCLLESMHHSMPCAVAPT